MKTTREFRLDEILLERGLTIRGFARSAKMNHATISRISHNQTRGITLDMISRLCDALNVSHGELFRVVNKKK